MGLFSKKKKDDTKRIDFDNLPDPEGEVEDLEEELEEDYGEEDYDAPEPIKSKTKKTTKRNSFTNQDKRMKREKERVTDEDEDEEEEKMEEEKPQSIPPVKKKIPRQQDKQVVQVPVFISESDTKKMIYEMYLSNQRIISLIDKINSYIDSSEE